MNKHVPYFYIIEDTRNGKYYGGSKFAQGCHPSTFLVEGGYTTSSKTVNQIIDKHGMDVFIVRKIKHFSSPHEAFQYETRFLSRINAEHNPQWYNRNNGTLPPTFTGTFWYNDGKKNYRLSITDTVPNNYSKGRLKYKYPKNRKRKTKEDCMKNSSNRGKTCFTNGKKNIYLFENEMIPAGFYQGTMNTGKKPQISEGMKKYHDKCRRSQLRD